jgi:hypothetical protein
VAEERRALAAALSTPRRWGSLRDGAGQFRETAQPSPERRRRLITDNLRPDIP